MFGLTTLAQKVIGAAIALLLLVSVVATAYRYWQHSRSQAAQAKVERSQSEAYQNSATEALNTVSAVGANAAESEALSRSNEREIRAAPGADVKVSKEVQSAGIQALCRRKAYANSARCHPAKP